LYAKLLPYLIKCVLARFLRALCEEFPQRYILPSQGNLIGKIVISFLFLDFRNQKDLTIRRSDEEMLMFGQLENICDTCLVCWTLECSAMSC
jgi:hypothetical protein